MPPRLTFSAAVLLPVDFGKKVAVKPLANDTVALDIFAINDTEGNVGPSSLIVDDIAKQKAALDAKGADTLTVHSGDMFIGALNGKHFDSTTAEKLYALWGRVVDIFVPGNHDFDDGPNFLRLAEKYHAPKGVRDPNKKPLFLSGNLTEATQTTFVKVVHPQPYVVKTLHDGTRIGIVGMTKPAVEEKLHHNPLQIASLDSPETVAKTAAQVKELRAKGIEIIILVSHAGQNKHRRDYVPNIPGVDIILGGDDHIALNKKGGLWIQNPSDKSRAPVLIAENHAAGSAYGKIHAVFNRKTGTLIPEKTTVTSVTPQGEFTDAQLRSFYPSNPESLAHLTEPFRFPYERTRPSAFNQWVSYGLLHGISEWSGQAAADQASRQPKRSWLRRLGEFLGLVKRPAFDSASLAPLVACPQPDTVMIRSSSYRAALPQGNINTTMLREAFPLSNRLVLLEVDGQAIINELNYLARERWKVDTFTDSKGTPFEVADPRTLLPANIHFTIDALKHQLGDVQIFKNNQWQPVDPKGRYTVLVDEYTAFGREEKPYYRGLDQNGKPYLPVFKAGVNAPEGNTANVIWEMPKDTDFRECVELLFRQEAAANNGNVSFSAPKTFALAPQQKHFAIVEGKDPIYFE